MTLYPFDMQLVVDPFNSSNVVTNGQVYLYHPSDVHNSTPLNLTDPNGLPLINPVMSNSNGFLGAFQADTPQVKWASAGFYGYFNSFAGLRSEAIAAKDAAQEALVSAAGAVVNAAAAAASAKASAELVGTVPDSQVKVLVSTTTSQTRQALDNIYAPKAGGGGGTTIINTGSSVNASRRPLIGARVGAGSINTITDDQYFDELNDLEAIMRAKVDLTNWYRGVGVDSASDFTETCKPMLLANPQRQLLYVLEMDKSNAQFNKEFAEKNGIYPHLVKTLQAIKDSGVADRVVLAPFHEGNGGGGSAGSIGSYDWHMYDTDLGKLVTPNPNDWKTEAGTPYGPDIRLNTVDQYKIAFKNVVNLVRSMGLPCKIVQWFLAANSADSLLVDKIDRMDMAHGYVGDEYVDIIGLSYYNRSGDIRYSNTWPQAGANGLREFYNAFEGMTGNPLWVCESGSAPSNALGDQAQWYADMIKLTASNELPRLEGYIMFMQDTRKPDGKGGTQGANMKLDSALDDANGGSPAKVIAAKRMVGKAINAAKRVTRVNTIPPMSRNLLPIVISDLLSMDSWDFGGLATASAVVGPQYTPTSFDSNVNGMHITKPAWQSTDEKSSHTVFRAVTKVSIDYTPNNPYVLTFWARAETDGFRLEAGMRQHGDPALTLGDELVLSPFWEQYVIPFSSQSDEPTLTSWRIPNFMFGNNKNTQPTWFEIAGLRLTRGTEPSANVEPLKRPEKKTMTNAANLTWNCETADLYTVTVTQNSVLMAPTGEGYDGQEITLRVTQGGAGGYYLNLHSGFYSDLPHVMLASGVGAKTVLKFHYDGDDQRWGLLTQSNLDLPSVP